MSLAVPAGLDELTAPWVEAALAEGGRLARPVDGCEAWR